MNQTRERKPAHTSCRTRIDPHLALYNHHNIVVATHSDACHGPVTVRAELAMRIEKQTLVLLLVCFFDAGTFIGNCLEYYSAPTELVSSGRTPCQHRPQPWTQFDELHLATFVRKAEH